MTNIIGWPLLFVTSFTLVANPSIALDDIEEILDAAVARGVEELYVDSLPARAASGPSAPENQTEAPAATSNASTLLDTSSASDLIAVAANFAGLTGALEQDSGEDGGNAVATVSLYAIQSALTANDPLSPDIYCRDLSRKARRLNFTIGHEEGEDDLGNAFLVGFKYRLPLGGRLKKFAAVDVCDHSAFATPEIKDAVRKYAGVNIDAQALVIEVLRNSEAGIELVNSKAVDRDRVDPFLTEMVKVDEDLNEIAVRAANELVAHELALSQRSFAAALRKEANRLQGESGNQLALEFLTKQRQGDDSDEYTAMLIWDHKALWAWEDAGTGAVKGALDLTLNAGWEMRDERNGQDDQAGNLAFGLTYRGVSQPDSRARAGRFTLSTSAKWLRDGSDQYRGQAKLVLPIIAGVELPISVTVANRTDLIEEEDVRGMVGFTVDTASLLNRFTR